MLFSSDYAIIVALLVSAYHVVVLTCIAVIEIGQLRKVLDSCVCLLKAGNADSHVIGSFEILVIFPT